jgi:topoisomerase IV subunit A
VKDILSKIFDYSLEEIMGDRFGRYSKYIIQDRAIPDVRDGLKPVQRRILYAMFREKNTYDKPYRKSVKTVGNVIGNYHPHGDSSVYEAMVRMSQSWKQKNRYIQMHGNNGSIDGDNAAAMRYTEARLSKISNELLKDIDKNTVMLSPNFDDTAFEPTVLPSRFPNLLVNGSNGISAGYATNIPPHNLGEIIDATIKRIDSPNCRLETILELVKGPDFPTGGIACGKEGIIDAYTTGKGKIILKSKVTIEKNKGREDLVITEVPYEVNKASMVRKIDEIRIDKKIEGIIEVRDESDRDGLRVVVELKKDTNSEVILNYLLKNTDLQVSYNYNMVAIVNRRPKLLGILDILDAYINHQKEVVTRRTEFDLEHAKARLHIVEGLIKVISILDEVIATIRGSENKVNAKENLISSYAFSEMQAEAIVMLQLYRLTNTDVTLLIDEQNNLNMIIKGLMAILSDEENLKDVIKEELRKIKKEYNVERMTEIIDEIVEIKLDNAVIIPKEEVIVIVSKDGYVRRIPYKTYTTVEEVALKEGDYILGIYKMSTTDTLLLFTDLGNYLYLPVYDIIDSKIKDIGKHISNLIKIKDDENIIGSMPVYNFNDNTYITIFTKNGMIKRTKLDEFKVQRYSKPIMAINLKDNDVVTNIEYKVATDVLISTYKGYCLWFDINEVPIVGIKASGVKSINLKDDYVINGNIFDKNNIEYISVITDKCYLKRVRLSELDKISRAKRGLLIIREVKSNPQFLKKVLTINTKDIIGLKIGDEINYLKNSELTITDRYSVGSLGYKGNVSDVFIKQEVIAKVKKENDTENDDDNDIELIEPKKEKTSVSLKEIDDRIMTIDDFLDDFSL